MASKEGMEGTATPGYGAGQTGEKGAAEDFRSAGELIKAGTSQAIDEAKAAVIDMADDQKRRAAEGLGGFAHALHEAARSLSGEHQEVPARYAEMVADQVDQVSQMLRTRDWQELVSDAESFARRQPSLFIGGAVAAGFLLARFLKSGEMATGYRQPAAGPGEGLESYEAAASSFTETPAPGEVAP